MHSAPSHPAGMFLGSAVSVMFLVFSCVPDVPPVVAWLCALLSATASILTIRKLNKK